MTDSDRVSVIIEETQRLRVVDRDEAERLVGEGLARYVEREVRDDIQETR